MPEHAPARLAEPDVWSAAPRSPGRVGSAATGAVFAGIGVAVSAMAVLHLTTAGRLDPLTTTVSDYVSVPGGRVLLSLSVLAIAVATAAVPIGLRPPAWLWVPFGLGCVGLLASIAFPTNALGAAVSVDTVLHRYAAGLFFVSLPVAAWLTRLPAVRRATAWSVGAGIAFLVSHVPLVLPGWPGAHLIATVLPRGLAERVLLVVDLGLLSALGRAVR
ncbi:MAG TPA: DUF998 domain-containing protein [Pseudonocardiaceae bacterium]|nr:DUF998 domain-containing protein [Pseudonocardiaceae bacterium]